MNRNKRGKKDILTLLSILTVAIGLLLLGYMIMVEDEPGLIPLLLIAGGVVWWYVIKIMSGKPEV